MAKTKIVKSIILMLIAVLLSVFFVGCVTNPVGDDDTYKLTLNYNDGSSRPGLLFVDKGENVIQPDEPIRTGYSFGGWFTSAENGTEVAFPFVPSSDDEIFALWNPGVYDVIFDLNYENTSSWPVQKIAYKESIDAPSEIAQRQGYVFRHWSIRRDGRTAVTFPYVISGNTTFYASWRSADIKVFDMIFDYGDYDGAPADLIYEIEEGDAVQRSQAVAVSRTGYALSGWALEDGTVISFPYIPTSNTTVHAVWERQEYTLRFRYNYPDSPSLDYDTHTFHYGDEIYAPAQDPTREDYEFEGWYTADIGGNPVQFPATLARNSTYYAHWKSVPVTTDIFHAEYVSFDPNMVYPGNSGSARGANCVFPYNSAGILVDNYPTNSSRPAGQAFCVNYQYTNEARLVFEITATETITGASLIVNWATERNLTFGPTGTNAYVVTVNGTPVNYTPVALQSYGSAPGAFTRITLATNITLTAGLNTVVMQPNNSNGVGTMECSAPITDYIEFSYSSSDRLSWSPVYDNLNNRG